MTKDFAEKFLFALLVLFAGTVGVAWIEGFVSMFI